VPVRAKNVVTFKPGKEMEARVREVVWDGTDAAADSDPPEAGDEST
jgi:hypothetical protein